MADMEIDLDVSIDTPPPDTSTFVANIRNLCDKSREIKHSITSLLSKSSFSDVSVSMLSGQGNSKVTKYILAENLLSLISIVDKVDPVINDSTSDIGIGPANAMPDTSEFDKYLADIQE